jgi:hypothetical protein
VYTYAITANKVELSIVGAGRPGTTRVRMTLTSGQLEKAVPMIAASKAGLVHDVLDAWAFLEVG